jgi:hypothetical protein
LPERTTVTNPTNGLLSGKPNPSGAEIKVVAMHVAGTTQGSNVSYKIVIKHHPSQHNKDQPALNGSFIQVLIHQSPQPPTLGTDLD